jgi:hypothetical protein
MEPRREEQQKPAPPRPEPKPKRFRIVTLEERIAPKWGSTKKPTWPKCEVSVNETCFAGCLGSIE